MKPFSRVVIAFFCMTCLMCGCTRDISRSEQISERIEQLEKVSRSDGEGFLAYAIKDNISHLTNRLEQVALARRFADKVFSIEIAVGPSMPERRFYLFLVVFMTFEELQLYEDILWCRIRAIEWCQKEHSRLCGISEKDKVTFDMLNEIAAFHKKAVANYEQNLVSRYGAHVPPKALEEINYRFRKARTLKEAVAPAP